MRDPGLFYPRGPSNQDQTHFYAYKGLEGRFQKKKKKVFAACPDYIDKSGTGFLFAKAPLSVLLCTFLSVWIKPQAQKSNLQYKPKRVTNS